MVLKTSFGLFCFLFIWGFELISIDYPKGLPRVMKRLVSLDAISVNFSVVCLIIRLYRIYYPSKVSLRYQDMLYIISYTSTAVSVSLYWFLYILDSSLVEDYEAGDRPEEYYCEIFMNGGNLALLTWYGLNLESLSTLKLKLLTVFQTVFAAWYLGVLIAFRIVTGGHVYPFIDKIDRTQGFQILLVIVLVSFTCFVGVPKLIRENIKFKKIRD
jgi:multisubunit Na+/H+ antiporter MnhF subunit